MGEVIERAVAGDAETDWATFPSSVTAEALRRGEPTPYTTADSDADADETVRGLKITGIHFVHDFIEVHIGDVILTGYTEPFGIIGCQGVGHASITRLIGKVVEQLSVVAGEYVAIDSGENRLAFPIGGPSAKGPESVRLYRPSHEELGIPAAHWVW